ncbi:MAG: hypothetical protein ACRDSX_06975 [Mycobacterium sp.]
MDTETSKRLVEEATSKAGLIWVAPAGADRPHAAWHVWHGGAAYLVTGGPEQAVPGLDGAEAAVVTVASKDNGARLVSWQADVSRVEPGSRQWEEVVPVLQAKRLNAQDGQQQPARWARESSVFRLQPTGSIIEAPDRIPTDAHAAAPPASPATTSGRLPYMFGRRS